MYISKMNSYPNYFPKLTKISLKLAFLMIWCMFFFLGGTWKDWGVGNGHKEGIGGVDLGVTGIF